MQFVPNLDWVDDARPTQILTQQATEQERDFAGSSGFAERKQHGQSALGFIESQRRGSIQSYVVFWIEPGLPAQVFCDGSAMISALGGRFFSEQFKTFE